MKTFADIRVGDSLYVINGIDLTIHKVEDIWREMDGGVLILYGEIMNLRVSPLDMKFPSFHNGLYRSYYADPDVADKALKDMISTLYKGVRRIEEDTNPHYKI